MLCCFLVQFAELKQQIGSADPGADAGAFGLSETQPQQHQE